MTLRREYMIIGLAMPMLLLTVLTSWWLRPREAEAPPDLSEQVLGEFSEAVPLTYTNLPEIGADAPLRMPIPTVLTTPTLTPTPTVVLMPTARARNAYATPSPLPTRISTAALTPTVMPTPSPTTSTITATGTIYDQAQSQRSLVLSFPRSGGPISQLSVTDCTTGNVDGLVTAAGLITGTLAGMCVIESADYQGTGNFEGTLVMDQRVGSGTFTAQSGGTIVEGHWTITW